MWLIAGRWIVASSWEDITLVVPDQDAEGLFLGSIVICVAQYHAEKWTDHHIAIAIPWKWDDIDYGSQKAPKNGII